jgi:hypothetical protein
VEFSPAKEESHVQHSINDPTEEWRAVPGRPVIRHLNGDPTDCRPENLTWGSESENARDRVAHSRDAYARCGRCLNGHRYTPENTYRRPSKPNVRRCQTCDRAYRQARTLAGVA